MDPESKTGAPAGLYRRLAALLYDLLLAIAIAFVATAAMLPLTHAAAVNPEIIRHIARADALAPRALPEAGQPLLSLAAWR